MPEADPDDARKLLNYRTAFEFVSECLDSGDPITEGVIREIRRELVEGVRGGSAAIRIFRIAGENGPGVATARKFWMVQRVGN